MTDDEALKKSVQVVAEAWQESTYYDHAEQFTHMFWNEDTIFRRLFEQLDHDTVVDLACGHGRHAEIAASKCRRLYIIDVHPENIEFCRKRLEKNVNIDFFVGQGTAFDGIKDSAVTAIYCYDAMVRFSPDLVEAYLLDSTRVLRPSGKVLLHHSNYDAPSGQHYGLNPHARNHMTFEMFDDLAKKAGLKVLESVAMDWGEKDLDRVTLLQKP